ncbi:MAG: BREX-1 system phosphatase PglZ type A [Caldilineaceae bacterium]|nr:BREX-1 system phosphatase PglZ type A [Caldilineaceae bacterium]
MNQVQQSLAKLFERHRIILWYDTKQELHAEFDALTLPGVEKIVLDNNQFGVKFTILRQYPHRKFLLYQAGPQPADLDNWLLDVELAHGLFRADQTALWLVELGLGQEFVDVVAPHAEFFQSASRRAALKGLLKPDDTPRQVRLKLLAVAAGADPRLDDIVEMLLAELAAGKDAKMKLIARCGLDTFLWEQLERAYGYASSSPSIRDFAITLFKAGYALALGEPAALASDALVFLKRWKDSLRHQEAFETLSGEYAKLLKIEQDLQHRDYSTLAELDLFELIDRKVLSGLARGVADRTVAASACAQIVRARRQGHWFGRYRDAYEAVDVAVHFFDLVSKLDLTVRSLAEGVRQYCQTWYLADQLYRHFVYHARSSGQMTLLGKLLDQVENLYTNNYLLPLNDRWQSFVDGSSRWDAAPILGQQAFFAEFVRTFLRRGNKVSVIISDALRYEAGEELLRLIRQEDRYDAEIAPLLATLPSYTQLGMAALLPHDELAFSDDGAGSVLVDGLSSQGTENRKAILEKALAGRGTAIKAEALLALSRDESRALIRDSDVVYVYHNRIDAAGDKLESEDKVFEAVAAALDELVKIVKKLTNANANNLIVTADHGFIYQQRTLDESDFASQEPSGARITVKNRRFVLGTGLSPTSSFKHFRAADVGLAGETEILLPKSINRLRVKGAGSRYVHGGAALQEVVVPVVSINKKRQSDLSNVEVDILRGSSSIISTGQVSVAFYQVEPVTEKVQPRMLRAGIYTEAGVLVSDQHELTFDFTAENGRERELRVQFVLTRQAEAANNQEVILRLEERVPDTTYYREYKAIRYTLRRSFTSDFDF